MKENSNKKLNNQQSKKAKSKSIGYKQYRQTRVQTQDNPILYQRNRKQNLKTEMKI